MAHFPDTGKIQDEFFKEIIYPFCGSNRKEVLTPPQYGVDVSLISMPNGYEMALTSDPLTLIPTLGLRESAWLSVVLMANDMATTGKAPMYAQFVLNLPATLSSQDFDTYWKHIHTFCAEMGTAITGGHTGRFEGQNSTVAGGGTMITIAPAGEMLVSKNASENDVIIVTKESALIACSILALSFPQTVANKCGKEVQQKATELFYETTSLQAGLTAASINTNESKAVTAMHDVTEGGILGAIYEMALASGCGVAVDEKALPTGDVQKQVCNAFGIDPHFSIGAGSMIIAVKPDSAVELIDALQSKGIKATAVGKFLNKTKGINLFTNGIKKPLQHPGTDPYWKAFHEAFAKGLK
ncbi:MAG TPA: AIR synthase family protein [Segetibacter sp.]|nr:AIR synthase family protein [Segetibacter sp.]